MRSRSLSAARETFVVASYTVLATASIQPERYPRTPALILHPTWRRAALVHHMVSLDAAILYLQEVERETFATLQARLGPLGYAAHCAQKGGGQPDGGVTLYRKALSTVPDMGVLAYADGQRAVADADHIALFVLLRAAGPPARHCEHASGVGPPRHTARGAARLSADHRAVDNVCAPGGDWPGMAPLWRPQRDTGQRGGGCA